MFAFQSAQALVCLELRVIEHHWWLATEERNKYCDFAPHYVNISNYADLSCEWTIKDAFTLNFGKTGVCLRLFSFFNDPSWDRLKLLFKWTSALKTVLSSLNPRLRCAAIRARTRQRSAAVSTMPPTRQSFFFTGRASFATQVHNILVSSHIGWRWKWVLYVPKQRRPHFFSQVSMDEFYR